MIDRVFLCFLLIPLVLPPSLYLYNNVIFDQAAQGGGGVSLSEDIQDPPGRGAVQPAAGDPASAGGLD